MTMNWLRPVIGLVAQPLRAARTPNAAKHLKNLRMAADSTALQRDWM
jgi:hypothetical protein